MERRARRRIIRSATTPKQGLNALFSFFPFAFELSSPSSPPLFTFDALAAAARARSSATGLTPRERSHGVAGVWTKERGAARGGGGRARPEREIRKKKERKKWVKSQKKTAALAQKKTRPVLRRPEVPFFALFFVSLAPLTLFFQASELTNNNYAALPGSRRRASGPGDGKGREHSCCCRSKKSSSPCPSSFFFCPLDLDDLDDDRVFFCC